MQRILQVRGRVPKIEAAGAYLAGIRSDDPNRAYRAADAWISRVHRRPKETVENVTATGWRALIQGRRRYAK